MCLMCERWCLVCSFNSPNWRNIQVISNEMDMKECIEETHIWASSLVLRYILSCHGVMGMVQNLWAPWFSPQSIAAIYGCSWLLLHGLADDIIYIYSWDLWKSLAWRYFIGFYPESIPILQCQNLHLCVGQNLKLARTNSLPIYTTCFTFTVHPASSLSLVSLITYPHTLDSKWCTYIL